MKTEWMSRLLSSDDLNRTHMVLHIIFGKQVFRQMRRDLLTNIVSLAGECFNTGTHLRRFNSFDFSRPGWHL